MAWPGHRAHGFALALVLAQGPAQALAQAHAQTDPQVPVAGSAAALHEMRQSLRPQLRVSAFGEPLVLSSRDTGDQIEGDVHAEVAHPFAAVVSSFRSTEAICEVLFLHLNVRYCVPSRGTQPAMVALLVGPKRVSAPGLQHRVDYVVRTEVAQPDHFRVTLTAAHGPLSTHDYRLVFETVPIEAGRSFVHFGYAYRYGALARLAMGAYLATAGRTKIGFSVEGQDADGRPRHVRGMRAAVERNVMRYYLALLAHRSVTTGSPEERLQARLRAWFALTERHPAQLHEFGLEDYLQEKKEDLERISGPN